MSPTGRWIWSRILVGLPIALFGIARGDAAWAARSDAREASPAQLIEGIQPSCAERPGIWARAAHGPKLRFCQLLERATAAMWSHPEKARGFLNEARGLIPDTLEVEFLAAELELSVGDSAESHRLFELAFTHQAQLPRHLNPSHRVAAVAATLEGDYGTAFTHSRALALTTFAQLTKEERERAFLETALLALLAGPEFVDEANSYLDACVHLDAPLLRPMVQGVGALSRLLDGGPLPSSRPDASEAGWTLAWIFERTRVSRGAPGERWPVVPAAVRQVLVAAAHEQSDRAAAKEVWSEVIEEDLALPPHLRALASQRAAAVK